MSGRNMWEIDREHVEKKTESLKVRPGPSSLNDGYAGFSLSFKVDS